MNHFTGPDDDDGEGNQSGRARIRGVAEEDDDGKGKGCRRIHERENIPPGPDDPDPPCER